ncbi:hypothetical protein KSC_095280 [Ktedonobacter sp. SOSP1-52]|uniref:hypothetical protein n=1 Tax=Ktedonobacter sp. SOSP1-52 TaxID=2778366 RepID=UPI001914F1C7|nr:hypothetical protein [Ktedonobacter sp. SOSP1-52]GHO69602.1 hypothetical protein KSC_084940 [Ktedonobacter sp. SOSP1-52]GHO70636.1 hypothetical protein KSC_095280 [Ktedonobacter sp. SOSP1-52]
MTKRKDYAILTQSTASTNIASAGATHTRQAHGPAGLRFINKKKNEPEHPEQLKSGMQKYNGTSLIEHLSIAKNTVPVNSANKAMK